MPAGVVPPERRLPRDHQGLHRGHVPDQLGTSTDQPTGPRRLAAAAVTHVHVLGRMLGCMLGRSALGLLPRLPLRIAASYFVAFMPCCCPAVSCCGTPALGLHSDPFLHNRSSLFICSNSILTSTASSPQGTYCTTHAVLPPSHFNCTVVPSLSTFTLPVVMLTTPLLMVRLWGSSCIVIVTLEL